MNAIDRIKRLQSEWQIIQAEIERQGQSPILLHLLSDRDVTIREQIATTQNALRYNTAQCLVEDSPFNAAGATFWLVCQRGFHFYQKQQQQQDDLIREIRVKEYYNGFFFFDAKTNEEIYLSLPSTKEDLARNLNRKLSFMEIPREGVYTSYKQYALFESREQAIAGMIASINDGIENYQKEIAEIKTKRKEIMTAYREAKKKDRSLRNEFVAINLRELIVGDDEDLRSTLNALITKCEQRIKRVRKNPELELGRMLYLAPNYIYPREWFAYFKIETGILFDIDDGNLIYIKNDSPPTTLNKYKYYRQRFHEENAHLTLDEALVARDRAYRQIIEQIDSKIKTLLAEKVPTTMKRLLRQVEKLRA